MAVAIIMASGCGIAIIGCILAFLAGGGRRGVIMATIALLTVSAFGILGMAVENAAAHSLYCHSDAFAAQYDGTCK